MLLSAGWSSLCRRGTSTWYTPPPAQYQCRCKAARAQYQAFRSASLGACAVELSSAGSTPNQRNGTGCSGNAIDLAEEGCGHVTAAVFFFSGPRLRLLIRRPPFLPSRTGEVVLSHLKSVTPTHAARNRHVTLWRGVTAMVPTAPSRTCQRTLSFAARSSAIRSLCGTKCTRIGLDCARPWCSSVRLSVFEGQWDGEFGTPNACSCV
eukprot:823314-Rhodomonas_salina.1